MKRFALLALGFFPLAASAGYPVSAQPASLNAPLPAAVQSAMPAGPTPASLLGSPSWGVTPQPAAACDTAAACAPATRPYFNLVTPRLPRPNGTCLDRIKQWLAFQPAPGGPGCAIRPYQTPARYFFRCPPSASCGAGGCAVGGCAVGGCAPAVGCGSVPMSVTPLAADAGGAGCRPRVDYQSTWPATSTKRVGPVLRLFTADGWCAPADAPPEVIPTGGTTTPIPAPTKWTARQPFTQP